MENIQINGQRRWGPPSNWLGPPPPHGTEIFVKNLPEDVFEIELYTIFSTSGRVYEVRLPIHWSGVNRGYCFIRFTKVTEADAAIRELDSFEIRPNRLIKVERSVDNTRLFLSSVPKEKNAEELKADLSSFVENVKKVYVYPTLEKRNLYRGYAFVEFETHRDAAIAKRILTPDVCFSIFEKKCIAAWANPLPFLDQNVLHTLNVLFLRNIPKEINGGHLKKSLENLLGEKELRRVKRLNDFAFLTFKDHESAKAALEKLNQNPFFITGYEVQVEWAIPRELVDSVSKKGKDGINDANVSGSRPEALTVNFEKLGLNDRLQDLSYDSSANLQISRMKSQQSDMQILNATSCRANAYQENLKIDFNYQRFLNGNQNLQFQCGPYDCLDLSLPPLTAKTTMPGYGSSKDSYPSPNSDSVCSAISEGSSCNQWPLPSAFSSGFLSSATTPTSISLNSLLQHSGSESSLSPPSGNNGTFMESNLKSIYPLHYGTLNGNSNQADKCDVDSFGIKKGY